MVVVMVVQFMVLRLKHMLLRPLLCLLPLRFYPLRHSHLAGLPLLGCHHSRLRFPQGCRQCGSLLFLSHPKLIFIFNNSPGFPAPPGFPDATGISPFPLPPSGARPPFPPFLPPGTTPPPGFPGFSPPGVAVPPGSGSVPGASPPPPPTFVPASNTNINTNQHLPIPTSAPSTLTGTLLPAPPAVQGDGIVQSVPVISSLPPVQPKGHAQGQSQPPQLTLPNPALKQTLPEVKKPTDLKWADPNYSPVGFCNFP